MMWLWLITSLNVILSVHAFSSGGFPQSCGSLLPQHGPFSPQSTDAPFELSFQEGNDGEPYTVFLRSTDSGSFSGFMLEAREVGGLLLGQFSAVGSNPTTLLDCEGLTASSVSQGNNQPKTSFEVKWTPPETGLNRNINLRATFVRSFTTFWTNVIIPISTETSTTTVPSTTQPITTQGSTRAKTTVSTTQAKTTVSTTQAKTTVSTTQPKTTVSTTQAKTTVSTTQAKTSVSTTQPKTTVSTTQPKTTVSTTQAKTTVSTTQAKTTVSTTQPKTTVSTTLAMTTVSTTQPKTTVSTTQPKTTVSTTQAMTTVSTTQEKTTVSTTQAKTEASTQTLKTTPSTTQPKTTSTPEAKTAASTTTSKITPSTTQQETEASATQATTASITNQAQNSRIDSQVEEICRSTSVLMVIDSALVVVKVELSNIITNAITESHPSHLPERISTAICLVFCGGVEIAALVLTIVCNSLQAILIALVCVVITLTILEILINSLPLGPGHNRKGIRDYSVKVCSLVHEAFTLAYIYVSYLEIADRTNSRESWPLWVLVGYTGWILLFVIWIFVITSQRSVILQRGESGSTANRGQQKTKRLIAAKVVVHTFSAIFIIGTVALAVAILVGILLLPEE